VLGPHGAGTCDHFGLSSPRIIQMGTFSKALGGLGGFVAAHASAVRILVNQARSLIYTTALPPAILAANLAALEWVQRDTTRRARLLRQASSLRKQVLALGFDVLGNQTPIVPIRIGDSERAVIFSKRLLAAGIWAPAIRPPTVPVGGARLRISLMATHTRAQITHLLAGLESVGKALRII